MSASDLAPFVAATLRDKVIAELKEENRELREKESKSKIVEVTGEGGEPVYAQGNFISDGQYHGNPNLWEVIFPEDSIVPCPLTALDGVEVRVGGDIRVKFSRFYMFQCHVNNPLPEDREVPRRGERLVNFCFTGGKVWLEGLVDGWSEESWQLARRLESNNIDATYPYLINTVAAEAPSKLISFPSITFSVESFSGLMKGAPEDKNTLDELEEKRKHMEYVGSVAMLMRAAGNSETVDAFMPHCNEVIFILMNKFGIQEPSDERFVSAVRAVIAIQMRTLADETREEFWEGVDRISTVRERGEDGRMMTVYRIDEEGRNSDGNRG